VTQEKLPVIFRADFDSGEITAVFPTLPHDERSDLVTCYAHVGQHGACSKDWFMGTRNATLGELQPLLRELQSIYSAPDDPEAVDLEVVGTWTIEHQRAAAKQREEWRDMRP
jgi:hypothetical protein